jgi:Tol biopolymer transport system component
LFKTKLDPVYGQEPVRLAAGVIERPVVAADSRVVIFARRSDSGFTLWSVRTDGGEPVQLSPHAWDSAPIVSPNLKRMAVAFPKGVLVCGAPVCADQSWVAVSSLVGWTPDGEGLTHTGDPGSSNIWVTRIRDGAVRQITRFDDQAITSISWSPNGRRLTVTRQHILTDLAWFTVLR